MLADVRGTECKAHVRDMRPLPVGVERTAAGVPLITRRRRAQDAAAPLLALPAVGDMVATSAGGWLHEHFFVGVCVAVDADTQTFSMHCYNRYNDTVAARGQTWRPAWYLRDGREVFTSRPPTTATPVVMVVRRADVISTGFELTQAEHLPAAVLRQISESPLSHFRLEH